MRPLAAFVCALIFPAALLAQGARPGPDEVLDALRLGELLQIMQNEALQAGEEIDATMLGGDGGASWRRTITRLNAPERLEPPLRRRFAASLPKAMPPQILEFLESTSGRRIVELELSARRALLDPDIEAASIEALEAAVAEDDPRLEQIRRFVEANALIDSNVVAALNANAAFLRGLQNAGDAPVPMSEAEILAEVQSQAPQIRADTTEWVLSYLTFAYGPLEDAELERYIDFSRTEPGKALNRGLFAAFDAMFLATSQATGEAVGRALRAEDI